MWTVLMVSLIWISITYKYGFESLFFLIIIDLLVLFLSRKFSGKKNVSLKFRSFISFIGSFFLSFFQSFRILFFLLSGKLHRGLYEVKVNELSRLDLFFLSMGITIVPNTIYIDKFGDVLLVHKVDKDVKAAHESDPILFFDKKKK